MIYLFTHNSVNDSLQPHQGWWCQVRVSEETYWHIAYAICIPNVGQTCESFTLE